MKKVRALFTCREIITTEWATNNKQKEVKLTAINEGPFWEATPMGELSITISNPAAADFFEPGRDYHLDFSVADEPPP